VSPWKPVPEPSTYQPPTYSSKKLSSSQQQTQNKIKHADINTHEDSSGYSGGENASSADDEGSRDGEDDDDDGRRGSPVSGTRFPIGSNSCAEKTDSSEVNDALSSGSATMPTRKTEIGKQGIAARRIQRTWKHFYKELEERKDSSTGLPSPLLSVIEEPSGESREQSIGESSSIASFQTGVPHYNTSASPSCASSNRRPTPSPPPTSRAGNLPPTPENMPNLDTSIISQALNPKETNDHKNKIETSDIADSSSNTNSTETIVEQSEAKIKDPAKEGAISLIQATLLAHNARQSALSSLNSAPEEPTPRSIRNRILTARPWQKKKASLAPSLSLMEEDEAGNDLSSSSSTSNLSEEEREGLISEEVLEHARRISLRAIQGVVKAHDIRSSALERLEADKDLFTNGKVSALKAKFNERRRSRANAAAMNIEGRSDGVTDDDDDVVY